MTDKQVSRSRSPPSRHNFLQGNDGDRGRYKDRTPPHYDRRDGRDDSPRSLKMKHDRSPSRGSNYRDDRDRDRRDRRDDRERYRDNRRSRSWSPLDKRNKSRYSRSRSRSRSRSYGGRRSPSHSPMSSRRRHTGNRDNPNPSGCLGVFGLSVYTTEVELYHIFSKYGPVERVQVVLDAKTGKSRGFSFVYFVSTEDAKVAKEECSGMKINGKNIRVDYSITQRAHTPTPGIYMGKPTYVPTSKWDRNRGRDRERERDRDEYPRKYRRSPSPYFRRRRYERSRSRSYSPRLRKRGIG